MKEKFLELVNEVKETGIVEAVYRSSNAAELEGIWNKFLEENPSLIEKIKEWAEKFKEAESGEIFDKDENVENPMEIVVVIFIIDDEENVSECEIFEDYEDHAKAMADIDNEVAKRITEFVECSYICRITAEDIFPEDDAAGEGAEET